MTKRDPQRVLPELEEFADQVGEFMEYWGFKKIHGQIWCHLYLSTDPMDAAELIRRLGISKALVSISLKDLLEFAVIEESGKSERGTRLYRARDDLAAAILETLRRRERKLMSRISAAHGLLEKVGVEELKAQGIPQDKVNQLGFLISLVDQSLNQLIRRENVSFGDLFAFFGKTSQLSQVQPNLRRSLSDSLGLPPPPETDQLPTF